MNDFTYYAPTRVRFGKDADSDVGGELKKLDATKILLHYGGGSARRSGLMDKITGSLKAAGLAYVELGGVEPNPKVGLVREAVKLCRAENVDFILAIGGGSVIDSGKSTSISVLSEHDPWDFITKAAIPEKRIPLGVVLTIAAAGSEMSNSHVLNNPELGLKKGLNDDIVRPVISFLNPENTYTVSKYQTGCGVVDIMMHTLERYFTPDTDTELTDSLAEALLRTVKHAGAIAVREPENYNARADLMWASSLSHNGLTGCGKIVPTMTVHQLEHGVSGLFDRVAHGAGLSVLYPAWAKFIYKQDTRRFSQMAVNVWGVSPCEDSELTAFRGVEAMKDYFHSLDMPVTMGELGIAQDSYGALADAITGSGTRKIWSYIPLGRDEILEIFHLAE